MLLEAALAHAGQCGAHKLDLEVWPDNGRAIAPTPRWGLSSRGSGATTTAAPIERHPVASLLVGAWSRRDRLRLADALYVELAASRALPLITTDRRLRSVRLVEVVVA
jgi:predicted nucleic acid-binding protein